MKQKITSFEKNLHLFGCFPSKTLLFRGGFPLFQNPCLSSFLFIYRNKKTKSKKATTDKKRTRFQVRYFHKATILRMRPGTKMIFLIVLPSIQGTILGLALAKATASS